MFTRFTAVLLVLLAAIALAGCGGDDSSSKDSGYGDSASETKEESGGDDSDAAASGGGGALTLGVDGNNLEFDKTELTAKAGAVTIELKNTSSIQHNVAIEDEDGEAMGEEGELVGDDETSTATADLEPGTYTYYCSPHKSSGMTGTLTVT